MAVLAPSTSKALRTKVRLALTTAAMLAGAAFLVSAGCAGGPSLQRVLTIEPGRRTTVRMVQFDEGRMLTLQNKSSGSALEVYKDPRSDPLAKVVDDDLLQRLLDIFADRGLFTGASSVAPPEARDALIVEQNDRRYVFHRRGYAADAARTYLEAKNYFLDAYNRAEAFHTSNIHRGDLEAETSRAQNTADAARLKLERLKRRRQ